MGEATRNKSLDQPRPITYGNNKQPNGWRKPMKLTSIRTLGIALLAIIMIGGLSGCGKKNAQLDTGSTINDASSNSGAETTTVTGLPEVDSDTLFDKAAGLQAIYFDYNSYSLRPDALATLKANAELIKRNKDALIQIEGHCDERGTQEYNLTLGEKRALATREYLMSMGVSGDRMVTISYGEEDPADAGHTEAAWAKNRRSEFNKAL